MYAKNRIQCASEKVIGPNVVDGYEEGAAGGNGGEQKIIALKAAADQL
ncbi:hypothetical protein [Paenibacillus phytohabitans]